MKKKQEEEDEDHEGKKMIEKPIRTAMFNDAFYFLFFGLNSTE